MGAIPKKQETLTWFKKNPLVRLCALIFSLCFVPGSFIFLICTMAHKNGYVYKKPLLLTNALVVVFILLATVSWAW
ncbi:MAG: hypothetical protein ACP5G0_01830 [Desulfomonilia bacterium]